MRRKVILGILWLCYLALCMIMAGWHKHAGLSFGPAMLSIGVVVMVAVFLALKIKPW
jgi:hypothetical protein